jgi:tetratricopeptide (TPR) repeat protein
MCCSGRHAPLPALRPASRSATRGSASPPAGSHDGKQERHQALTRLFDYYLHSAATAMAVLRPAERTTLDAVRLVGAQAAIVPGPIGSPAAALAWLDGERACLLDAVEYMVENGWPGHVGRMADVLLWYLDGRGHYAEAVILHDYGRRAARQVADRAAEARALIGLGVVAIRQGRYQDGTSHFQRALDLYRAQGDSAGAVLPLGNLGIVALRQGRYPQAADHLQQKARRHWQAALAIFTDLGIPVDRVPGHLLAQRPDQNIAALTLTLGEPAHSSCRAGPARR